METQLPAVDNTAVENTAFDNAAFDNAAFERAIAEDSPAGVKAAGVDFTVAFTAGEEPSLFARAALSGALHVVFDLVHQSYSEFTSNMQAYLNSGSSVLSPPAVKAAVIALACGELQIGQFEFAILAFLLIEPLGYLVPTDAPRAEAAAVARFCRQISQNTVNGDFTSAERIAEDPEFPVDSVAWFFTPLELAALASLEDVAVDLCHRGASPNTYCCAPPLFFAFSPHVAEALLAVGARPDAEGFWKRCSSRANAFESALFVRNFELCRASAALARPASLIAALGSLAAATFAIEECGVRPNKSSLLDFCAAEEPATALAVIALYPGIPSFVASLDEEELAAYPAHIRTAVAPLWAAARARATAALRRAMTHAVWRPGGPGFAAASARFAAASAAFTPR